ncbi:HlyD family secretion protein [Desulfogranum mediterraneum]|uniref:HlyD family secretion protein n=1 Tax=Desulfogranum mediterraneum TaxID=160661 RepID=UPI0004061B9F|nr:HlyD family efflux transporter periplasmic adaptor subunit [Desulfogranum mediterraneum]
MGYRGKLLFLGLLLVLSGCRESPPQALGTLEWDRLNSRTPAGELITELAVREGSRVAAGSVLVRIDDRKISQQLAEIQARLEQAGWRLKELENGPRPQEITRARARVSAARAALEFRRTLVVRQQELLATAASSRQKLDLAENNAIQARNELTVAEQELALLQAGTRIEQLEQARARESELRAHLAYLKLLREEYTIRASRAGLVDSLPFKAGDRPPAQAVVCTLLAGKQPWARVYVPEPFRSRLRPGATYSLLIDGRDRAFKARLRSISSEAAFTPYFALSEQDRARLSYLAQLDLIEEDAESLSAGTPVQLILE